MTNGKKTPGSLATKVVVITGPSGAGRSTAIHALEDLGYETIDNLPLVLLERLLAGPPVTGPIAVGIDVRTRDFSVSGVLEALHSIRQQPGLEGVLLYVDCDTEQLVRRYNETRRRHPMAAAGSPLSGIQQEKQLLVGLKDRADVLIDTTDLAPREMGSEIGRWFKEAGSAALTLTIQSFSYKRGTPRGVDMVLDCRFLKNPHWQADLREMTGQDDEVSEYVRSDPRYAPFVKHVDALMSFLLPAYQDEGKTHFNLSFGCTGGQHRSVCVSEAVAKKLALADWQVSIRHRELERRGST